MGLFDKKKKVIDVDGQKIELQPKPASLGLFHKGPKQPKPQSQPAGATAQPQQPQAPQPPSPQLTASQDMKQRMQVSQQNLESLKQSMQQQNTTATAKQAVKSATLKKPSNFRMYLEGIGAKKKGLEFAMREQGMKTSLYEFVRNMLMASVMLGVVIGITTIVLFQHIGLTLPAGIVLGGLLGFMAFFMAFQTFLNFPTHKSNGSAKNIERDILFAARDMIISLRSGMPLFNAITSISTGYGDASKEFAKIIERVQLGTSLEDAIDQTVSSSKSVSFRRIMLQAAVSIRAGADVVSALQSVIDQLSQEQIIELRRYGQKLNAIAMFYMLFGIILPSMGIAVVTILTTFIAIFTVNVTILEAALVGIVFLQIVFLKMITSSRPVFTM